MTDHIITESDFLRTMQALIADQRPVPLPLTDNERQLVRAGLRTVHTSSRDFLLGQDLIALPLDRMFQLVVALQHVKPTKGLLHRVSEQQCVVLKQIAFRLADIVTTRQPGMAEVIDTGW